MGRQSVPERLLAIAAGEPVYLTGKPCNLGLISVRTVSGNKCQCDLHRAARVRRASVNYLQNRNSRIEKQKQYAEVNKAAITAYKGLHYSANKAAYLAKASTWAAGNRDKRKEITSEWAKRNPAVLLANTQRRRARLMQAVPSWFGELDEFVAREAHAVARQREIATGIKWEVDHVVPLAGRKVCGLHVAANMQVIPMTDNRRKSNHHAV